MTGLVVKRVNNPRAQRFAQKVKAGRGWLIVRNSGTLADTDYESVADEIVAALNARTDLVAALQACAQFAGMSASEQQAHAISEDEFRARLLAIGKEARAALAKAGSL